jgi:two-component system response regulator AtoC
MGYALGNAPVHRRADDSSGSPTIVVLNPTMRRIHARVQRAATRPLLDVLIVGETGVGKNLIADQLQRQSARSEKPPRRIDCGASNDSLTKLRPFINASETESPRSSIAETVLLEGVAELDAPLQSRLLRALDAFDAERRAARGADAIAVRFVSLASRNLATEVARGTFRSDLFFRISALSIVVPPLRERQEEVVPLAQSFLETAATELSLGPRPRFSPEALTRLQEHRWPGNVRELRNVVERAALFCTDATIRADDLEFDDVIAPASVFSGAIALKANGIAIARSSGEPPQPKVRAAEERARILAALGTCHGNQTRAALLLGMPRRTLVAKLTAHAIPRPRKACGT